MRRCKICGGTGIIYDRNIQAGSQGEFRVCDCIVKQCKCGAVPPYQVFDEKGVHSWCDCRSAMIRLEAAKKAFRESQIPRKFRLKFLDDFKSVSPKDIYEAIFTFIAKINTEDPNTKWNKGFYLWGPSGSGKTLLACIFLQELILKYAQRGRFVDLSRQFFQRLRSSYDITDESYGTSGRILDELIEIPFLVIDDFGTQRNTEWESEMLYNLIDSRYEEERITIITSNLSIKEYKDSDIIKEPVNESPYIPKEVGKQIELNSKVMVKGWEKKSKKRFENKNIEIAKGRIYSRILEMCKIIHVDFPDYRESISQYGIFKNENNK